MGKNYKVGDRLKSITGSWLEDDIVIIGYNANGSKYKVERYGNWYTDVDYIPRENVDSRYQPYEETIVSRILEKYGKSNT